MLCTDEFGLSAGMPIIAIFMNFANAPDALLSEAARQRETE